MPSEFGLGPILISLKVIFSNPTGMRTLFIVFDFTKMGALFALAYIDKKVSISADEKFFISSKKAGGNV